jgi:flagellar biosynthesis/type III secretory pathway protein FliH
MTRLLYHKKKFRQQLQSRLVPIKTQILKKFRHDYLTLQAKQTVSQVSQMIAEIKDEKNHWLK